MKQHVLTTTYVNSNSLEITVCQTFEDLLILATFHSCVSQESVSTGEHMEKENIL